MIFVNFLLLFVIQFCSLLVEEKGYEIQYDLNKPDTILELPSILNEISGLTDIDNDHIACTQDELGIIYILDLNNGKIKEKYSFEPIGDFEGLTHVDGMFYILRSDGRITFLPDYKKPNEQVHIKENLLTKDNEGLCYDKKHNRLLIAAKSKPDKNSTFEDEDRLFYQFDLKKAKLQTYPVFVLKINDVIQFAKENSILLPVYSTDKKNKKINFRPSSLAVHPISQFIYIISAADYLLIVCNNKGQIIQMTKLNPELYQKAEGITFLPDNTMIITNEAKNHKPTLLKFKYKSS